MSVMLGRRSFIARIAAFFAGTALFGVKRSEASIQGIEPMLGEFYASLSDQQRRRFNSALR